MVTYLGYFGLSWKEKVAAAMYSYLPKDKRKLLKDFWQEGGYNTKLISYLYDYYLINDRDSLTPSALSLLSSQDIIICEAFLTSLKSLATNGKIDYKIYRPDITKSAAEVKATYNPISSITSTVSSATNKILIGLSITALSIYLLKKKGQ